MFKNIGDKNKEQLDEIEYQGVRQLDAIDKQKKKLKAVNEQKEQLKKVRVKKTTNKKN